MQKIFITEIIIDNIINVFIIFCCFVVLKNKNRFFIFLADITGMKKSMYNVLEIILLIIAVYLFFKSIVPDVRDIPYINNNYYFEIYGTAMSNNTHNSRSSGAVLYISDEEGSISKIRIKTNMNINKGDYVKVKYLPNSKRGVIIEHKKK